jgi:hypothetical protein
MSDNDQVAYVALQPINHLGVRAYNPGDRVHANNVKAHGYEVGVQVAKVGTKAADAVTAPRQATGDEQGLAQAREAATAGTVPAQPGADQPAGEPKTRSKSS